MIGSKQLRVGMIIRYQDDLWKVIDAVHMAPGKGGAFVQVKLRNVIKGNQTQHKYRSGESIERIVLDTKQVEYLYGDGEMLHFMDTTTFEQFSVDQTMLDDKLGYLTPNLQLMVEMHDGLVLDVQLPKVVKLKVTECEPYIKTATATNSFKTAMTETGASIQIPGFIEVGEWVDVDPETGKYMARAKEDG